MADVTEISLEIAKYNSIREVAYFQLLEFLKNFDWEPGNKVYKKMRENEEVKWGISDPPVYIPGTWGEVRKNFNQGKLTKEEYLRLLKDISANEI